STKNGYSLNFPLLEDPGNIFHVFMGQDADLVKFSSQFHLQASHTEPLAWWPPFSIVGRGTIDMDAYLNIGYDTYGIRQFLDNTNAKSLLNGLYTQGNTDDPYNPKGTLFNFKGTIGLEGHVGLPVAYVGGGGYVSADLFVGLNAEAPKKYGDKARLFEDNP